MNKTSPFVPRLARVALALACCVLPTVHLGLAQTETRPPIRDVTPPGVTRAYRSGETQSFIPKDAIRLERASVDKSGMLQADERSLELYGASLIPRKRICTSAAGARWTCGNHAFMAIRNLLDGRPIACSFKNGTSPPKAICWLANNDLAQTLLAQGWAELADGVTDKLYVEAATTAQSRRVGIWADGPP